MLLHNMPKAKKTETTQEIPVVQVEPITKNTKSKSKKSEPVPVVANKSTNKENTEVKETISTNEVIETTTDVQFSDTFSEFLAKLQNVAVQINSLKTEFRTLEKKVVKELKTAQKFQAKRKRKNTNRSPSGFVKPTLISNELANFLNKPIGTEMARTEVTREINGYIRLHSLQDKSNGRKINPDKCLATLLKINNGEELTYFNLQRYMSPHFAKANSTTTTAVTASK